MNSPRLSRPTSTLLAGLCAAALLAPAALHAQQAGANDTRALAARVQRLEDTAAIQTLLLDYGRNLDARDFKGYSELFAKDGIWTGGFGTVQGRAAIQTFMEKAMPGAGVRS